MFSLYSYPSSKQKHLESKFLISTLSVSPLHDAKQVSFKFRSWSNISRAGMIRSSSMKTRVSDSLEGHWQSPMMSVKAPPFCYAKFWKAGFKAHSTDSKQVPDP